MFYMQKIFTTRTFEEHIKCFTSNNNSAEHLKRFDSYLNSSRLNISFAIENEKDNRMSFLDVNIICEKDKVITSVYCKPTFSGIYTHFDSLLPSSNKIGLFHTLLYRCFGICCDWTKFT